jgi:hypothetical protein
MNQRIKTAIAVGVLGASTLGLYSSSFAAPQPATISPQFNQPSKMMKHRHCHRFAMRHHHFKPWRLGLRYNKNLTVDDAKTITKAALLMYGRHDLKVGDIQAKTTKRGHKVYVIQILKPDNKVASTVIMGSRTGFIRPLNARVKAKLFNS